MEIYWRDNFTCPSEDEYKQMIVRKTGGLFNLAVRYIFPGFETDIYPLDYNRFENLTKVAILKTHSSFKIRQLTFIFKQKKVHLITFKFQKKESTSKTVKLFY